MTSCWYTIKYTLTKLDNPWLTVSKHCLFVFVPDQRSYQSEPKNKQTGKIIIRKTIEKCYHSVYIYGLYNAIFSYFSLLFLSLPIWTIISSISCPEAITKWSLQNLYFRLKSLCVISHYDNLYFYFFSIFTLYVSYTLGKVKIATTAEMKKR